MAGLPRNMGAIDRVIRGAIGVILLAAVVMSIVAGTAAWVVGIIGAVLLATSVLAFCPLYPLIGMKTCSD